MKYKQHELTQTLNPMLTSIRHSDSIKVLAQHSDKRDGPFACPKCGMTTILRKGRVKIAHFAHKPPILCEYGKGESEHHKRCKEAIYNELCQFKNLYCELEKDLGKVVPDIYIESIRTKNKCAIEVQISNLTMDKIISRTQEYYRLGIYVLWLPVYNEELKKDKYAPRAWEKWLHAVYFGRVYYWISGLSIVPIHFDDYQLYIEESTWYIEGGDEMSAGGYYKKSKRYRTPNRGNTLALTQSFVAIERKEWNTQEIFVPECRILLDNSKQWWDNKGRSNIK